MTDVAALMITNPNTLGLFETNIEAIAEVVHAKGGLVYLDGANLNALMGIAKPGHMGVDVLHMNLHKTFSTPHGGGGPGAGPVAVKRALSDYLPRATHRQDTANASSSRKMGQNRLDACARFLATSAFSCGPTLTFFRSAATGSKRRAGWRC